MSIKDGLQSGFFMFFMPKAENVIILWALDVIVLRDQI
jgi:hypothetical protein